MGDDQQLQAFVVDARAHATARGRRHRRSLREQLRSDLSFEQVCVRAIEERLLVDVHVSSGRTHRGSVSRSEGGLVVADGRSTAYIVRAAVTGLRTGPPHPQPATTPFAGVDFDELLDVLVARGCRLAVGTDDGRLHHGVLASVGRDVVSMVEGLHVPISKVTELIIAA